jgi:tetratricopeptide (TPR) repeat protein
MRGSLVYGKAGSCFVYMDSLLRGKPPRLAGAAIDELGEMRAHIIHSLEDLGELTCSAFQAAFARDPEEAFPREFAALKAAKRLVRSGDKIFLADPQSDQRYLCSVRFYGPEILRLLSRRTGGGAPLVQTYGGVGGGPMDPDTYVPAVGSREHLRRLNEEGMRSLKAGNAERAARCFEAALKINPRDLSAMLNRAAAAVQRGDLQEAKRLYDQSIGAIPGGADTLADALSSRAFVNKRLGKAREAVIDLRKALRHAPKSWSRREEVRRVLDKFLSMPSRKGKGGA